MSGERKKNKITIELYPETEQAFRELDPFLLWHKPSKDIGESIGNAIERIYYKFLCDDERLEKLYLPYRGSKSEKVYEHFLLLEEVKKLDEYQQWRFARYYFEFWNKREEILQEDYYAPLS